MSFRLAAAAVAAIIAIPGAASAQALSQHDVSLRMGLKIAEAALAECGDRTSVAIVDRAGRLRVFLPDTSLEELLAQTVHRWAPATRASAVARLAENGFGNEAALLQRLASR